MSRTAADVRLAVQAHIDKDYTDLLNQIEKGIDRSIQDQKTSCAVYPTVHVTDELKNRVKTELESRGFGVIYSPPKGWPEESQQMFLISS